MMVASIDHGDPNIRSVQNPGGMQASEAGSDDYQMRKFRPHDPFRHPCAISRYLAEDPPAIGATVSKNTDSSGASTAWGRPA